MGNQGFSVGGNLFMKILLVLEEKYEQLLKVLIFWLSMGILQKTRVLASYWLTWQMT